MARLDTNSMQMQHRLHNPSHRKSINPMSFHGSPQALNMGKENNHPCNKFVTPDKHSRHIVSLNSGMSISIVIDLHIVSHSLLTDGTFTFIMSNSMPVKFEHQRY